MTMRAGPAPTPVVAPCAACAALRAREYRSVHEAIVGLEADALVARTERVAHHPSEHRAVHRCRECGALYSQGCFTSGQMEIHYLHPLPASVLPSFSRRGYDLPREPSRPHAFVHPEGIPWRFARPRPSWVRRVTWSPTAQRLAFAAGEYCAASDPFLTRVVLTCNGQTGIHDLGYDVEGARLAVARGQVPTAFASEPEDESSFECRIEIYDAVSLIELARETRDEPVTELPPEWRHGVRAAPSDTTCASGPFEARWGEAVSPGTFLEVWHGDERVGHLTE